MWSTRERTRDSIIGPTLLFACVLLFLAWETTVGRASTGALQANRTNPQFGARVDLVVLPVSVLDSDDLPVAGLMRDDFLVREDGVELEVALLLGPEEASLDIALLMDTSETMGEMEEAAKNGALNFLDQLSDDDCVFLLLFRHVTAPGIWGGPQDPDLRAAISNSSMAGGTALRNAVAEGFDRLEYDAYRCWAEPLPTGGGQELERSRPALVVVTDGIDQHSRLTFEDLLSISKQVGTPFFPVGFGAIAVPPQVLRRAQSASAYSGIAMMESPTLTQRRVNELQTLARVTGGEFIRGGRSIGRLNAAYLEVIRQLRSYYLVGYYPAPPSSAAADSTIPSWREVEVSLRLPGYQVRTRAGYYHMPFDPVGANRHARTAADLIARGEPAEALVELNLALQSDPDSWEAHYQLGNVHLRRGNWQEAQQTLLKAASLRPGWGEVHRLASRASLHLKDYAEAWEQAIRAHQAGIDMSNDLLMLRWETGEPPGLEARLSAPTIYIDSGRLIDPIERFVMQRVSRSLARELAQVPELGLIDLGARADYRLQLTMEELSDWRPPQVELDLVLSTSKTTVPDRNYRRGVRISDIEDRDRIAAELAPHVNEILKRVLERQ
jgi:VWFA-related protein